MGDLEWRFQDVLKEMLGNIERGEYGLIIGMDASGRLPTLIMIEFINYIYKKKRHDLPLTD